MAEIDRDCPSRSYNIERLNTPDTLPEIEEDFSWLHVFRHDHRHDHRCSPSRRSSIASSSSSGVASSSQVSPSELSPPVGGCFSDSGCDDFVSSSSSSSKSRQSSTSECNAVKPETSEEPQQRQTEPAYSSSRGLNPYAPPFDPRQSLNRHLDELKKRRNEEESWTEDDDGLHGCAPAIGEFKKEEAIATTISEDVPTNEAPKEEKAPSIKKSTVQRRSSYRLIMSFNALPYSGKHSVRK